MVYNELMKFKSFQDTFDASKMAPVFGEFTCILLLCIVA